MKVARFQAGGRPKLPSITNHMRPMSLGQTKTKAKGPSNNLRKEDADFRAQM